MRCTRVWEVGDRSALHTPRPVGARSLVPGDIVPRLVPDAGTPTVDSVLPTGSEMNALTVCQWCWGARTQPPKPQPRERRVRHERRPGQVEIAGQACRRFCPHGLTRGYRA